MSASTPVWDWPLRLFHWALVGLFGFSWWCAAHQHLDWHYRSGMGLVGLVIFRLIWGVIGSNTARFASFVRGPGQILAYVRGRVPVRAGHNPLGALAVLGLLGLMAAQLGTGLFAVDTDGLESGPLSALVSFDAGRVAADWHALSFSALKLLVALHLAALAFYRVVRGRNLVRPMLTGRDPMVPADAGALEPAPLWRLAVAAIVAGGLSWWIARGAPLP